MKIKVWVDRPKCATFASCTIADEPVFILDDEGKAVLDIEKLKATANVKSIEALSDENGPYWIVDTDDAIWFENSINAGALRCPVFAIVLTNMDTNEVIFPK